MTSNHPNFDKGLATRTQVMGQDFVDNALGGAPERRDGTKVGR